MSTNGGIAEDRSLGPALRLRDAPTHDLTRGRLRTLAWEAISHDLYAPLDPKRSRLEHARALTPALPRESGFGHLTAAGLRGWWLPHRLGSHVWLATTTSAVHIQRRGLYVRRSRLAEFDDLDGVPVVSAAQTLVDLAREQALSRLRLERYGYTSDEIVRRLGRIIRDAEEARNLSHEPRRVRIW
jgi:hypothetical protein